MNKNEETTRTNLVQWYKCVECDFKSNDYPFKSRLKDLLKDIGENCPVCGNSLVYHSGYPEGHKVPKEPNDLGVFDIFEDRAKSLLTRWRKFVDTNSQANPEKAIIGFLAEIDDQFTKSLIEDDSLRVKTRTERFLHQAQLAEKAQMELMHRVLKDPESEIIGDEIHCTAEEGERILGYKLDDPITCDRQEVQIKPIDKILVRDKFNEAGWNQFKEMYQQLQLIEERIPGAIDNLYDLIDGGGDDELYTLLAAVLEFKDLRDGRYSRFDKINGKYPRTLFCHDCLKRSGCTHKGTPCKDFVEDQDSLIHE